MSPSEIFIYNNLTARREVFKPLEPGKVKMYVCGITPYDESHLGHARCYVFFDTVKRILTHSGYSVTHVQNFTDIDDKIIARARETNQPPLRGRLIRIIDRRRTHDVWLFTNVEDSRRLPVKVASQFYRWRWENEGFFRTYRHYKREFQTPG